MKQGNKDKLQEVLDQFSDEGWEAKEQESPFWKPEERGDHIKGTVKEETESKHGTAFAIETEEGEERLVGAYTALEDQLRECVDEQEEVVIIYAGEVKGKNGTYKNFEVMEQPEETPSAS
jgi:hypothetical protein